MMNEHLNQNEVSRGSILNTDFETRLLASKLVSEVRKSPDRISITLTGEGVLEFAKAMRQSSLEDVLGEKHVGVGLQSLPMEYGSLISKKDVMNVLDVSHTTLWKWEKSGYLKPVKIGKRIFYRREDLVRLTK